jgi:hypothetical protein
MQRTTEIEIEYSETIAYTRPDERLESFCSECNECVEMAAPHVAAIVTHSSEREIYRLVETGQVHFVEADRVLVCLRSLARIEGEI